VLASETVALPLAPRTACAPFTVSLAATLVMGREAMPASAVPVSGFATTCASAGAASALANATTHAMPIVRLMAVSLRCAQVVLPAGSVTCAL
jgi:hypothetical protein